MVDADPLDFGLSSDLVLRLSMPGNDRLQARRVVPDDADGGVMYCVSAVYRTPNDRFDVEYYTKKHVPWFVGLFGEHCKRWEVTVPADIPGRPPAPFVAAIYMWIDSPEAFAQVVAEHRDEIYADLPNYSASPPETALAELVAEG
jgi:uncharacterized protein (TIGR02118 family)